MDVRLRTGRPDFKGIQKSAFGYSWLRAPAKPGWREWHSIRAALRETALQGAARWLSVTQLAFGRQMRRPKQPCAMTNYPSYRTVVPCPSIFPKDPDFPRQTSNHVLAATRVLPAASKTRETPAPAARKLAAR
jgi:hypothetical protein